MRDTAEAAALARSAGRVQRDHCRLIFTLDGTTLTLANVQSDDDRATMYVYAGPAGRFQLVDVRYYEGSAYMLVEPDGVHILVAGPPTFSPDSSRFASLSMDLEAEYNPNEVQVWRVDRDHPRLEFAITSGEWGPSNAVWAGSDTLYFEQHFPTAKLDVYRTQRARLVHGGQGWTLSVMNEGAIGTMRNRARTPRTHSSRSP